MVLSSAQLTIHLSLRKNKARLILPECPLYISEDSFAGDSFKSKTLINFSLLPVTKCWFFASNDTVLTLEWL